MIKHKIPLQNIDKLERLLGNPNDHHNTYDFNYFLRYDDAGKFPLEAEATLNDFNLNQYFVPSTLGGKLVRYDELMLLMRSLFRRDGALGLGYGLTSFMAGVPIWLAGSREQQTRAAKLLSVKQKIAIAFHEQDHGNDILNMQSYAYKSEDQFILNADKWLINNAKHSAALTLYARTRPTNSARSFSLFFIDKALLNVKQYHYLPKLPTLGMRSCRLSGISFEHCELSEDALIGDEGRGFEYTLRAFQVTRALLPGMTLSMIDTAFRKTLEFAYGRQLYRHRVYDIPHAKDTLRNSYIKLLIADALSLFAARGLHIIPQQMSVYSALCKYFVPMLGQQCLTQLSLILGARRYIREGHFAIFQKIMRDYPVISLGHASSSVCLSTIIPQLKQLLKATPQQYDTDHYFQQLFNLESELPTINFQALKLSNNGQDLLLNLVSVLRQTLNKLAKSTTTIMLGEMITFLEKKKSSLTKKVMTSLNTNTLEDQHCFVLAKEYATLAVSICWLAQCLASGEDALLACCILGIIELYPNQIAIKHEDLVSWQQQVDHLIFSQYEKQQAFSLPFIHHPSYQGDYHDTAIC